MFKVGDKVKVSITDKITGESFVETDATVLKVKDCPVLLRKEFLIEMEGVAPIWVHKFNGSIKKVAHDSSQA